jgi:hypothetical protein
MLTRTHHRSVSQKDVKCLLVNSLIELTMRNQLVTKCHTGPWNWVGCCEYINELSSSIKVGNFLTS